MSKQVLDSEIELEIELLLPEVKDAADTCVDRLQRQLEGIRGISQAHVSGRDGLANLCPHYEAGLVSLESIRGQAARLGAEMSDRYRHDAFAIEGMDCSECTAAIEHAVRRLDGVLAASGVGEERDGR
ncbi:MAG: hypothetical protein C0506_13280 [Anaerolinea sp.]|nr:hypothetical protein [Anaerolinea sp.]